MKDFKKLIREAYLGNPLNESVTPFTRVHYIASPAPRKMLVQDLKDLFGDDLETVTNFMDDGGYESVLVFNLRDSDIERIEDEIGDVITGEYSLKKVKEIQEALNEGYDDKDIVIYDGEEHIIMRKDGNMVYIRPLEDSAILGKKDEIKVPARALAYKSDLDKMYDEYKPKDEINEEFSSTEQKMIKQIQSYKKRDSAMVNLPSKVRDFYFKNKEKIDALNENTDKLKPAGPTNEDLQLDVNLYNQENPGMFSKADEKVQVTIPGEFGDNEGDTALQKALAKLGKKYASYKVKDVKELNEEGDTDVGGGAKENDDELDIKSSSDAALDNAVKDMGESKGFDFKKMVKEALTPKNLK